MGWELELSPQIWLSLGRDPAPVEGLRPLRLAPGQSLVIGRGRDCDVYLPHPAVARRHVRVWRDEDGIWVEDLNTRGGTWWVGHLHPEWSQTRGPTRLAVDDAFQVCAFAFVLTARFPVEERWRVWGGGVIPRLARAIQDGQSWEELPVLADALEESGCEEVELLQHFREVPHRLGWCPVLSHLREACPR